jgi:hypothetical protein
LVTEWFFDAPVERVWLEVCDSQGWTTWPEWWSDWKEMKLRGSGEIGVGSIIDCEARAGLPYTLRYQLELEKIEAPHFTEFTVSGDLEGRGRWTLKEQDGGTAITYYWKVGTTNPILNFFGRFPFAKSMMEKNHDEMMARGFDGIKERLAT